MHKLASLAAAAGVLVCASNALADGPATIVIDDEPTAQHVETNAQEVATPKKTASGSRGGGIALVTVGGVGLGVAAIIGVVALADAAGHTFGCVAAITLGSTCSSHDYSGYGIGAGIAGGLGLVSMIAGAVVLSYAPSKSVAMQLGPTGGSLHVTF